MASQDDDLFDGMFDSQETRDSAPTAKKRPVAAEFQITNVKQPRQEPPGEETTPKQLVQPQNQVVRQEGRPAESQQQQQGPGMAQQSAGVQQGGGLAQSQGAGVAHASSQPQGIAMAQIPTQQQGAGVARMATQQHGAGVPTLEQTVQQQQQLLQLQNQLLAHQQQHPPQQQQPDTNGNSWSRYCFYRSAELDGQPCDKDVGVVTISQTFKLLEGGGSYRTGATVTLDSPVPWHTIPIATEFRVETPGTNICISKTKQTPYPPDNSIGFLSFYIF